MALVTTINGRRFVQFVCGNCGIEQTAITHGSAIAKRQLSMGDCYRARAALGKGGDHA